MDDKELKTAVKFINEKELDLFLEHHCANALEINEIKSLIRIGKEIVLEALDYEDKQHEDEFIQNICKGKPTLLSLVRIILADAKEFANEMMEQEEEEDRNNDNNTDRENRLIGQVLADKYEIIARIGKGGMGLVYLARHTNLNKFVAIKVLSDDMAKRRSAFERFTREARACAKIEHPNTVQISDFGVNADGLVYMVMEYIEGATLRKIIEEGPLTPERAVHIACQICAGISAAHRAGVVHRDLKPDNVMIQLIDGQEVVKVLDFGIAKLKDTQYQSSLTKTNSVLGTPNYMSPEQCSDAIVDARSDIYALGIMLYEMLSGQLPFQAATVPAIIVQQVTKEPTPLIKLCPKVPESLSHVVMRALIKEPSKRQQSAMDLASQLEAAITIANFPQSSSPSYANNALVEPKQWRVIYEGILDNSDKSKNRFLEGLQKGFGLPADKAAELIKGKRYIVKKAPTQLEANIVAERLRAIGAIVKVEVVVDKALLAAPNIGDDINALNGASESVGDSPIPTPMIVASIKSLPHYVGNKRTTFGQETNQELKIKEEILSHSNRLLSAKKIGTGNFLDDHREIVNHFLQQPTQKRITYWSSRLKPGSSTTSITVCSPNSKSDSFKVDESKRINAGQILIQWEASIFIKKQTVGTTKQAHRNVKGYLVENEDMGNPLLNPDSYNDELVATKVAMYGTSRISIPDSCVAVKAEYIMGEWIYKVYREKGKV